MKIAVILARSKSKRIIKKNIKIFCGKPIIAWPILAARKTKIFDRIIVSTDDKKIAKIARKYKADTPFLRPAKLADDFAGTSEVVAHAINWLKNHGEHPSSVCCLYATSAFAKPADITQAYNLMNLGKWNFVFSATSLDAQIARTFKLTRTGRVKMSYPKNYNKRTQDLTKNYRDAAQFYWGWSDAWLKKKRIFDKSSSILYLPKWRTVDIDTLEDWKFAEITKKAIISKKIF